MVMMMKMCAGEDECHNTQIHGVLLYYVAMVFFTYNKSCMCTYAEDFEENSTVVSVYKTNGVPQALFLLFSVKRRTDLDLERRDEKCTSICLK